MRKTTIAAAAILATTLSIPVSSARAADSHSYTLGLMAGVGGSLDADPDGGLGNTTLQASFGIWTQPGTQLVVRLGRLDQDAKGVFASFGGGNLSWANVAGEYRLRRPLYESGIYLGLGAYRFEGDRGSLGDDTAVGGVFGLTGEFDMTPKWAILVDLSVHYADLDVAQTFGIATAGVAYRF